MSSSTEPFSAARVGDDIEHTASKGWLVVGLIGGAIAGAAFTLATGGVGTAVLAATIAGAAGGGGLGEVLGSMSWAPTHESGKLVTGSPNVFINGKAAIIAHISTAKCDEHGPAPQYVAEGSSRVYINGFPAARVGDQLTCSATISKGSPNVLIGGEKVQTDPISPEFLTGLIKYYWGSDWRQPQYSQARRSHYLVWLGEWGAVMPVLSSVASYTVKVVMVRNGSHWVAHSQVALPEPEAG